MSKRDKVLSLIGLAMKAGKCVSGETMTESETKSGKAKFVIVAGDASENTKKKFGDMCKFYKVPFCFYGDKDTLGHAMGKEFRASLAILDEGFADGMPQVTESKNPELEKTVRIFPHRMKGEGHFLALLQKGEKQEEGKRLPESGKNKKLPEELEEFLGHIDRKFESSRMDLRGEKVYYMPEGLPTLRGIRFLRTGLLMGELKKNRFEPSQALAMNLKKEEYDQVIDLPLEDERVMKYLKGETLDVEDLVKPKDKGWYLICVDGYPLGFGKLVNQMLKNKYLPGWRWNS